ncbi:MAG TPA: DUF58 domain-containing protein [Thermaerobacter sp.]
MPPAMPLGTIRLQSWGMPFWTLAALVFAVTSGGPVPWFLVKFLAALHLLAALWAWVLARGLDVEVRVGRQRATVGEPVEVEVFVHNGSILPVPRLTASLPGPVAGVLSPRGPGAPAGEEAGMGTERYPGSGSGWTGPGGRTSAPRARGPRRWNDVREPAAPVATGVGPGRPARAPVGTWPHHVQPAAAGGPSGTVFYRSLGPWGSLVWRQTVVVLRRGRYTLGPVTVELQEPLGIFRVRREVAAETALTVYPRVVAVDELAVLPRQPFGQQRVDTRAWQDPSSLADVRPFRPGDNPKHIHWKLSARLDELHVKEFELRATTDCFLFPDLAGPPTGIGEADTPVAIAVPGDPHADAFAAGAGSAAADGGWAAAAAGPAAAEGAEGGRVTAAAGPTASDGRRAAPATRNAAGGAGFGFDRRAGAEGPSGGFRRPGGGFRKSPAAGATLAGPGGAPAEPDAPVDGAVDGSPGEPEATTVAGAVDGVPAQAETLPIDGAVDGSPAEPEGAPPTVSLEPGEWVAGVTAGVAALALDRELVVAAAAPTDRPYRLPPGRGPQHFRRLMEWLVDVDQPGGMPLADFLAAQRGWLTPRSAVLVVTHRLDRRLARVLVQLRGQGHAVGLWLVRDAAGAPEGARPVLGPVGGDGGGRTAGSADRVTGPAAHGGAGIQGGPERPVAVGRPAARQRPSGGPRGAPVPRRPAAWSRPAGPDAATPAGASRPRGTPHRQGPGEDETETLLRSLMKAGVAVHPVRVPPSVPVARGAVPWTGGPVAGSGSRATTGGGRTGGSGRSGAGPRR